MAQSISEINAELQQWYAARAACASGKSFTLSTSAGMRVVTYQDLDDIQKVIADLERKVSAPTGSEGHNFALANFNNDAQR